jgi:hypothetical protein
MYQNVRQCTSMYIGERGMSKEPSGARLISMGISSDLAERFLDFCEGYEGAPVHRLLARAMEFYMDARYEAEPEVKRRAEEARKRRVPR